MQPQIVTCINQCINSCVQSHPIHPRDHTQSQNICCLLGITTTIDFN